MAKPSYAFGDLTTHPTTIGGYEISDAKITSGTITLGSDTISPVTAITWDSNNKKLTRTINGEAADVVTAATLRTDLGLSNAMHFIGVATETITDGGIEDPTISGYTTKTAGDVVIDKNTRREYVWSTAGKWEMLGFDASAEYEEATSGNTFISKITQATDGTVTADSRALDTSGTWNGTAKSAETTADTSNTLYVVGVTSDATNTLKHDTGVTV